MSSAAAAAMADEVRVVKTDSSTLRETKVTSEAVIIELRRQRVYFTSLAILMLLMMVITAWLFPSPEMMPWHKPTVNSNFLPAEAKTVDLRQKESTPVEGYPITQGNDTIVVDSLAYNDAGYQCSVNYDGVTQMRRMQYCKHLGLPSGFWYWFYRHDVHFGKYFVGETTSCYIIDETEENLGIRPDTAFLSFLGIKKEKILYLEVYGDSRFIEVAEYHKGVDCKVIEYMHSTWLQLKDIEGVVLSIREFIIARALVWSEQCQRMQLIPALYSEKVQKCFYGDGEGQAVKVTSECQVLCSGSGIQQDSGWLLTNP